MPITQLLFEEIDVVTGTYVAISEDGVSRTGDCPLLLPSVTYTGQLVSFE